MSKWWIQALRIVVNAGPAAGRIYIRWNQATKVGEASDPALSSLWIGKDFFGTCAYSRKGFLVEPRRSLERKCTKAFTIGSASVVDNLSNLLVKLWAYSMEGDIAIFGACRSYMPSTTRSDQSLSESRTSMFYYPS